VPAKLAASAKALIVKAFIIFSSHSSHLVLGELTQEWHDETR
jgi:hypothetical protein